jgi:hypothetical protein
VYATPLTGERNESSVLFSLAMLGKQAPAPPAPKVTESSALIDIRALVSSAAKADAAAPRADELMDASASGAFAPLFAPPVTFAPVAPADTERAARHGKGPMVVGAISLAVVALVSVVAFAEVRSRSGAPAVTRSTAPSAPPEASSLAGTAPSISSAVAAVEAPPAPSVQPVAITPPRTTTTPSARPARSAARASDARPVGVQAPAVTKASAPSKCCAGESEMACQMRLSVGVSCGAPPLASRASP